MRILLISNKKLAAAVCVVAFLLAASWLGYKFAFGAATGTIKEATTVRNESEKPVAKPLTLQGRNFTLEYSSDYSSITDTSQQDHNALEAYRLNNSSGMLSTKAVIVVKKLAAGGLSEESSYRMRSQQADVYTETSLPGKAGKFTVMRRLDNTEAVGFGINHGKLVTIAITSARASEETLKALQALIQTFEWTN